MESRVLGVFSTRSGVGKSTTAINLAYLAASEGISTVLVDFDKESSSALYFKIKARTRKSLPSKKNAAGKRKSPLSRLVKETVYDNLSVLAAAKSIPRVEHISRDQKHGDLSAGMCSIISELRDQYPLVIIDTPSGRAGISDGILDNADVLLVPTKPNARSIRSLERIDRMFSKKQKSRDSIVPFFSMVDLHKQMHGDIVEIYSRNPRFLSVFIPDSRIVEQMEFRRIPLLSFNLNSGLSSNYLDLWGELRRRNKV